MTAGAIGPLMDAVHQALDGFLGTPKRKLTEDSVTLVYRTASEIPPVVPLKLKVEINTREHFSVLGYREEPFTMESRWFSGSCRITSYALDELLATKLRALYQRRKGRDLFDLWLGLTLGKADPSAIATVFRKYMQAEGHSVSRSEFRQNLAAKISVRPFVSDTDGLLRHTIRYDAREAFRLIDEVLLSQL